MKLEIYDPTYKAEKDHPFQRHAKIYLYIGSDPNSPISEIKNPHINDRFQNRTQHFLVDLYLDIRLPVHVSVKKFIVVSLSCIIT